MLCEWKPVNSDAEMLFIGVFVLSVATNSAGVANHVLSQESKCPFLWEVLTWAVSILVNISVSTQTIHLAQHTL